MHIAHLIERVPSLRYMQASLDAALTLLEQAARNGNTIFLCGNGGSAADAEHICGELMKGFLLKRPLTPVQKEKLAALGEEGRSLGSMLQRAIPAISLVAGVSLPTAFANDVAPVNVFAQQLFGLGKQGDVLWALSTSGNSSNVLQAARVAQAFGMSILSMTGKDGGELKKLSHVLLNVPSTSTPEIQELHLPIYHALCAELESKLFGV